MSRRLYVWAALLASVLVILGAGVGMLNALLQQVFSAHPKLDDPGNQDFGHYLAVIVVAAGIGIYHWRVLRADGAARPQKVVVEQPAPAVAVAATAVSAPIPASEAADPYSRGYVLSVTDATEDDIHQALSNLPPAASYKLTPTDHAAGRTQGALTNDGH